MRKFLLILFLTLLVACNNNDDELNKIREDQINSINENIDFIFATDSLTDIWHIEDHIYNGEELDSDRLLRFADEYILDEEMFESLNGYEKGLAMKTSVVISKTIKGEYEDIELFENDLKEYYDILANGDSFFLD